MKKVRPVVARNARELAKVLGLNIIHSEVRTVCKPWIFTGCRNSRRSEGRRLRTQGFTPQQEENAAALTRRQAPALL